MITPYEKAHYEFLNSLLYEPYNVEIRNRIYDFYEDQDVKAYLPRQLDRRNWLEYIIEFKELSLSTNRFKVVIEDGKHSIWKIG